MDLPRVTRPFDRSGLVLTAGALAVAAVAVLPTNSGPALAVYLGAAIAATWLAFAAIRAHRAGLPGGWWLVATAIGLNLAIDVLKTIEVVVGHPVLDGDVISFAYLVPYAVLAIGLAGLVRAQANRLDRAALLDATMIVLGVGFGAFFLATAIAMPSSSTSVADEATIAATFAVGLPSLTLAMWLSMIGGLPRQAAGLLLAAVAVQSAGDGMFGIEFANPAVMLPNEAAWLASLLLLSAAVVRGVSSGARSPDQPLVRDHVRLWLLGLAIVAPAIDSLEAYLTGRPRELISLLVLAVAGLAITRITYLLRQVSRLAADTEAYRRLTAELEDARRQYRTLVDASPGTSWTSRILDPATGETRRLYVSPQVEELTGYPSADFLSGARRWRAVMHPDDREAATERFQANARALAATDTPDVSAKVDEYRIVTRDGRVRWVRDAHQLVPGSDGEPATIHGLVLDITEQRLAEDEVRASEARFRALVEQFPGVVILREVTDGSPGRFVYVSAPVDRMLGFTPEQVSPGTDPWPAVIDPDSLPALQEARSRHLATGSRVVVLARVAPRPDRPGLARRVEITWVKVQELDARTWLSLGVVLDVTALREAEEELRTMNADLESRIAARTAELRTAQVEAERASRAKSEFLSSMSHELRTPLNAILGFGQLLQLAQLADPDRESADEIVRAGRNLLGMIEAVLEFSRLDAGRITLSIEPVELASLVRETFDLSGPGAVERGVTLADELGRTPGVVVLADRRRLGQILLNLVSNGIRYNRPGGRVALAAEVDDEKVRVLVSDTGIGIEADRLARLFEPFETMRGDHSAPQTLSLGLALSARLAGLMGGSLTVTSSPGRGSTFVLEIMRATPTDARLVDTGPLASAGLDGNVADGTILYIEDNLANLTLVERVIAGRFGVRVVAAMQGRMGLELAREHRPSLILLDLHLPDAEPGDVLRELRADERTASIPVVILSSDVEPGRHDEMQTLGADAFLAKPLDIERFVDVVARWLRPR